LVSLLLPGNEGQRELPLTHTCQSWCVCVPVIERARDCTVFCL
jgi:hypothetical protein